MRVTAWHLVTVRVAPDCGAKPPLLHVKSWHVQGKFINFKFIGTRIILIVE